MQFEILKIHLVEPQNKFYVSICSCMKVDYIQGSQVIMEAPQIIRSQWLV